MYDLWEQLRSDSLIWRIPMYSRAGQLVGKPEFDPPEAWTRALDSVARDLKCLRVGREVEMQRLVWEFEIDTAYTVSIGWESADGFGGFGRGEGMSMDADYSHAVAWVAETVQTHLAGYEFVQWPSQGRHLLTPRADEGGARWVDPHGQTVIADIGALCEH